MGDFLQVYIWLGRKKSSTYLWETKVQGKRKFLWNLGSHFVSLEFLDQVHSTYKSIVMHSCSVYIYYFEKKLLVLSICLVTILCDPKLSNIMLPYCFLTSFLEFTGNGCPWRPWSWTANRGCSFIAGKLMWTIYTISLAFQLNVS